MSADEPKPQTPNQPQQQRAPQQQGSQQGRPQGERRHDQQRGPRGDHQQAQRRQEGPRPKRSPEDRNVVFIGNKPPMNYVLAVVTQFNSGSDDVVIRARGKAIAQAVDVAEIVRNKFFQKASVKNVSIGTENITGDDGRKRAVSAIEIRLSQASSSAPAANASKPSLPQQNAPTSGPAEPAPPQKSAGV